MDIGESCDDIYFRDWSFCDSIKAYGCGLVDYSEFFVFGLVHRFRKKIKMKIIFVLIILGCLGCSAMPREGLPGHAELSIHRSAVGETSVSVSFYSR